MEFKNVSGKGLRDASLELAGAIDKYTVIKPNDVITVTDPNLIKRVKANPAYEVYGKSETKNETKAKNKAKKSIEPKKEVK